MQPESNKKFNLLFTRTIKTDTIERRSFPSSNSFPSTQTHPSYSSSSFFKHKNNNTNNNTTDPLADSWRSSKTNHENNSNKNTNIDDDKILSWRSSKSVKPTSETLTPSSSSSSSLLIETNKEYMDVNPLLNDLQKHYPNQLIQLSSTQYKLTISLPSDYPFPLSHYDLKLNLTPISPSTTTSSSTTSLITKDEKNRVPFTFIANELPLAYQQSIQSQLNQEWYQTHSVLKILDHLDQHLTEILAAPPEPTFNFRRSLITPQTKPVSLSSSSPSFSSSTTTTTTTNTTNTPTSRSSHGSNGNSAKSFSREKAIAEFERRFRSSDFKQLNDTLFYFTMIPTDPDVPVKLVLDLAMMIPLDYPTSGSCEFKFREETCLLDLSLQKKIEHDLKKQTNPMVSTPLGLTKYLDRYFMKYITHPTGTIYSKNEILKKKHNSTSTSCSLSRKLNLDSEIEKTTLLSLEEKDKENEEIEVETELESKGNKQRQGENEDEGMTVQLYEPMFHTIAVVQCTYLALQVKCCKCKQPAILQGPSMRTNSTVCEKCRLQLSFKFRSNMMTSLDFKLGRLSMTNAIVLGYLFSHLVFTCLECGEISKPIKKVLSSQSIRSNCHSCHQPLNFQFQGVQFSGHSLIVTDHRIPTTTSSSSSSLENKSMINKGKVSNFTLHPGTELPYQGTCKHYPNSFRWFRFSCCLQLFPCDTCHDDFITSHESDLGKTMVCGYCSKEQSVMVKCKFCQANLTKSSKRSNPQGFWEGGKGTRNPTLMNNKDSKKYKNLSKTQCMKSQRVGAAKKEETKKKK